MIHYPICRAFAIWGALLGMVGRSQSPTVPVQVINATQIEGIPGVVLLVNSGDSHKFRAFITDADGRASLPNLGCDICTITALDPAGYFFSRTTEFGQQSSKITLVLDAQPIIDTVGEPGAIAVGIKVYGPNKNIFPNHHIAVRPTRMTAETNWIYRGTTDQGGLIKAEFRAGDYTVAALIEGAPYEARVRVTKAADEKHPITVHLTPANTLP